MRKLSLLLAASVMAVGLAVSGGASAEQKPSAHEIISEGQIILATTGDPFKSNWVHLISVAHEGIVWACEVRRRGPYATPDYTSTTTCKTDYSD